MMPGTRDARPSADQWRIRLKTVKTKPNQWVLVQTCTTCHGARNMVYKLWAGEHQLPEGRWAFKAIMFEVFARYLGP